VNTLGSAAENPDSTAKAVAGLAQLLEAAGPALRQRVVPAVRRLVADGFLTLG
jgi:hypothetical protein